MIKTNKITYIIILFVIISLSFFALAFIQGATAENDILPTINLSEEVKANYYFGEAVNLPNGTVNYNGKEYVATRVLYCPDGTAKSADRVTLDISGEYVLEYIANIEGKFVSDKRSFIVSNELFTIEGKGSVSYGNFDGNFGAKAHLQDGDKIICNQVINLARFKDTDELFRMFGIPQSIGTEDFARFEVELIDVYDENNKIIIELKQYLTTGNHRNLYTYANAKYGDNVFIGLEVSRGGGVEIDFEGKRYVIHRGDQYGAPIRYSFTGMQAGVSIGEEWIGVCFGLENNVVRAKNQNSIIPVADMDGAEFLTEGFPGFTTGEIKVTIKPTNFVRSSCDIVITEFGGKAITADGSFKDDEKPILSVDYDGYDKLPDAIVGIPYKLFGATAFDSVDGDLEINRAVFYGYNTENAININIEDGAFIPKYQGIYTVKYSAKDKSGNLTFCTVEIVAKKSSGDLTLSLVGFKSTLTAGKKCNVIEDYIIANGTGRTSLKAIATLKNHTTIKYDLAEDFSFIPLYSGEYEISFNYSDYLREKTEIKTVTVNASDNVIYSEDKPFPQFLLLNGSYELPSVTATVVSSGKPETFDTELFIVEDGGAENAYNGEYTVSAKDSVTIKYKYKNATPYEIVIPVVDAGYNTNKYRMEKYFVGVKGEFNSAADKDGICYTITSLDGGAATLKFINAVDPTRLDFAVKPIINRALKNGAKFAFVLSDSKAKTDIAEFAFTVKADGVYLSVNSGPEYLVCETFTHSEDVITLSYSVKSGKVTLNEKLTVSVPIGKKADDIKISEGLTFSVRFENGFTVGDGLCFTDFNSQKLSNTARDRIEPTLVHENSYYGEKTIGDTVKILPAYAYDILSPEVNTYINVIGPDRKTVKDENGVSLDGTVRADVVRAVKFTEYGQYQFNIIAADSSDNETVFSFTAYVVAFTKPQVTVSYDTIRAVKGKMVKLDNYSVTGVSDLFSCTVFITVKLPDHTIAYLGDDVEFTPETRGKYIVRVSVMDEFENLGEATFTLIVD